MRIVLSMASQDPIYEQIVRQVRSQILAGDLSEGELLPSIRALARDLQISVITTKRAYEELEREGLIDSVGGKGTFVAAQNPEFIREKKMQSVEAKLAEAVDQARQLGVDPDQLAEMLRLLYPEGE
ncbi:MAG: GntR family transcriptional regulator [bacterium]|nr:GntR family transcriptional regulator [bacterium]